MKKILLLLILWTNIVQSKNYYFSSSTGDDTRSTLQAQNSATPWMSLGKLNVFFSSLSAGDSVLFKRGDTFYGSIIVNKAGMLGTTINLGAYGSGAKPIITGFNNVAAWTNVSSNVWQSTGPVSTLPTCNIISIGAVNYAMGRLPKTGYWTILSTNNSTTITDATHLNAATTNWTGATVVVRELMYQVNAHPITSASGNTITFGAGSIPVNWGYFIQNDTRACTQQNEWAYNSSTKKISMYSTSMPAAVNVPSVDEAVNLNSKDYICFDNLDFQGYNTTGINTTSRAGIKIQNCSFSFIGRNGVYGYPNSANLTVTYNTFTDIGSIAIESGSSSNEVINYNTLLRIGHFAGMGSNGDRSYTGIVAHGDNGQVKYNSITDVGYCGIRWDGNSTIIQGNFVNHTTYIKDDGAGIYGFPDLLGNVVQTFTTRTVRDNIVINCPGAAAGSPYGSQGCGIYMDGQAPNIRVIHNFVGNDNSTTTGFLGIFINGGHDIFCDSNTTYNWASGYYITKIGGPIDNETLTHNIMVALTVNASCGLGQYTANYRPSASSMPSSFVASNNVYAKPLNQTLGWIFSVMPGNACSTLAQWQTTTGKDAGSTSSPMIIGTLNDLRFEYNETSTPKIVSLGGFNYIDMKGVNYPGTITIQPNSSAVLIKTTADNVAPTSNAGIDQTITLPTSSVNLTGSGADSDGTIASYLWTEVSGPVAGTITTATTANTTITGLTTAGVYLFNLKVTDNNGAVANDMMQVTVNAAPVVVPVRTFTITVYSDFSIEIKP